MNETIVIPEEGWVQVVGPALSVMRINCINEGYERLELLTKDDVPYDSENGISLTTKEKNYQEAVATLAVGESLYVRVRGFSVGRLMTGELA